MLSVVLIVKNEEERLSGALRSVGRLGETVVCDTGSSDSTIEVAGRVGARVVETDWRDNFALARSHAQRHARCDWVMRMDADELFWVARGRPEEWLSAAIRRAERAEADRIYVLRRYSESNIHWFPRLFRASRHRWVKPLHELIAPVGVRRRAVAVPGAVILHRPSGRPRGYADMAARHLSRKPADPHLRYYWARGLWEEGRWREAAFALEQYLSGPADYWFHRGEAHRMLGNVLSQLDPGEGIRHLVEAAMGVGPRNEAVADLVRLLLRRGEKRRARHWIRLAAEAEPPRERAPWGGTTTPYLLDAAAWRPGLWRQLWRYAA